MKRYPSSMRLSTPSAAQTKIDLELPRTRQGADGTGSLPTIPPLYKSALSKLVVEANEKFKDDVSALSPLDSARRKRAFAPKAGARRSIVGKAEVEEADVTLAGIKSLMQQVATVYGGEDGASGRMASALDSKADKSGAGKSEKSEPSKRASVAASGGETKRTSLIASSDTKRASVVAAARQARVEALGVGAHMDDEDEDGGHRTRLSDVQILVRNRMKELREDPTKLNALRREMAQRKKGAVRAAGTRADATRSPPHDMMRRAHHTTSCDAPIRR